MWWLVGWLVTYASQTKHVLGTCVHASYIYGFATGTNACWQFPCSADSTLSEQSTSCIARTAGCSPQVQSRCVCVCVCVCVYHNSASLLIKILGCECIHDGLCFADCLFYCSSCCWKMAQHVKGKKHRIVLGLQPAASRKAKRKVDAANDATEKGEGQPPRGAAVVTEANTSATSSKSTVKSVAVSLDQPQPQPKAKAGKTNVQPETQSENSATVAVPAGVAKAKTRKKKKRKRKREAREIGT